jgi:glutamate-5-semialdehyde dehydrogenase
LGNFAKKLSELKENVTFLGDESSQKQLKQIESDLIWYEEFLDYKMSLEQPILIKKQSKNKQILWRSFGFHHYSNDAVAQEFMENVDTAAVYHNASTRFTDGGQFGWW